MCVKYPKRPERVSSELLGTGVTDNCEPQHLCRKPNLKSTANALFVCLFVLGFIYLFKSLYVALAGLELTMSIIESVG